MRLSLGEPVVAIPDFFAKPSNAPNNRIIDTHQAKHRVITQFEQNNAQSHNDRAFLFFGWTKFNELQMRE